MIFVPESLSKRQTIRDEPLNAEELLKAPPGERLRRTRKSRKLDLEAVAGQLNLSQGVVKALEADDYERLPAEAFVRGYIRNYAKLLSVPADDLVRAFDRIITIQKPSNLHETKAKKSIAGKSLRRLVVVAIILVFLICSALFLSKGSNTLLIQSDVLPSEPLPAVDSALESTLDATASTESIATTLNEELPPASEPDLGETDLTETETETEGVAEYVVLPSGGINKYNSSTEEGLAVTPALTLDAPVKNATDAPQQPGVLGQLEMHFSADCWVEIRDGSKKLIHVNLNKSGSHHIVEGTPPFDVKLGNGKAVTLTYNTTPVIIEISERTSVVRLTVGQ